MILAAIYLSTLIVLGSAKSLLYDKNFYEREFGKLGVYNNFEKRFIDQKAIMVQDYFRNNSELDSFFSEQEKLHMRDVKNIVLIFTRIYNIIFYTILIVLVLLIFYFFKMSRFVRNKYLTLISKSFILSFVFIAVLSGIFYISAGNFSDNFITFHKIIFSNDYWMLPEDSHLLQMFPEKFFFDFAEKTVINSLIFSATLAIIGLVTLIFLRKNRLCLPS